jgi:hypothetical protein
MLTKEQESVVSNAINNIKFGNYYFAELSTGFGKTNYVIPDISIKLAKEKKSNNFYI